MSLDAKMLVAGMAAETGLRACYGLTVLERLPLEEELEISKAGDHFLAAGEILAQLDGTLS